MKRIRAIKSFHSNGYSMFFGKEVEVDDELAEDWKNAGLVEIVGEAQRAEKKELTLKEIERKNLEAMAKQLGIVDGFDTLSDEELENNIHDKITKKRDEREAKLKESQGQEGNGQGDPAYTDEKQEDVTPLGENEEDKNPKKTKK